MVAEPWILKMGNQVSNNLKSALLLDPSKKKNNKRPEQKEIIGILSFEVANVISKTVHLHKSLTDQEVSRLKNEILKSEGVKNLVSSDESYLTELALAEKLDDLNHVASVVSRLGKRCTEPALQGFEHVYADIMTGVIDVKELGFLVKDMEGMIRKMERYVSATSNLYTEMQALNELEQASKKFQLTQHEETRRTYEQKLIWQGQDVRHLRDISLWNQTYDKIVALLARTVCTIYARICTVFGDSVSKLEFSNLSVLGSEFSSGGGSGSPPIHNQSGQLLRHLSGSRRSQMGHESLQPASSKTTAYNSGRIERVPVEKRGTNSRSGPISQRSILASFRPEYVNFPCGSSPGRLFSDCLSLSSSALSKLDGEVEHEVQNNQASGFRSAANGLKRDQTYFSGCSSQLELGIPFSVDQRQTKCSITSRAQFVPKSRLMLKAPSSTVGGSALALHYANVVIVIEKLLRYPHLVGDEARDDLYQMLPTSLRIYLRKNLKSYFKNLAIYDAPLAHDWKETLNKILTWFAPLAHNMIRWQTERNLEQQQQIVTRTNVLLIQTLYFADREKTEAAICQLLLGLTYICRYEHQQNALLDCASSFDFDDCVDWRWQETFL
ncbi:Protein of unknown function DUF668 [Macleaya cordata]|uniref:DUF668 domain-containing protein n=1 Tax=Macleaya cordata TaxID=56857 RepID=A0A200PW55_MACCD|nr:Protein of unknown function DUF668 [Macleaya cordata]